MTNDELSREELLTKIEQLRCRLEEAEETLGAIYNGEVDALVVARPGGEQIFTLQGAEQPYRVLVETMNEGAATLDLDGTILYCNQRLATMLHQPLEKLIGSRLDTYVAPADHALFSARLGNRLPGRGDKDEITLLTDTGKSIPVLISCCAVDLFGSQGINVVITDLSEHKRNEEIVASEKLARSIIEQAGEAIVVCDAAGLIIRASRSTQKLCGINPLLKPFDEVFALRLLAAERSFTVATPLAGGRLESVEVLFTRNDGKTYHLLLTAAPLTDEENTVIGCVVTLADITRQKQAEEEISKSLQEKEVLLKEIHHRVKNNLQVICSLISLQAKGIRDETVKEVLDDVSLRVRSMALVHEKLYQSADLARVDFAAYVRSLLDFLWRSHGVVASSVRLNLDLQQVFLPVDTAIPCGLILNELAGNAIKHAFSGRDGGDVTVALHTDEQGRVTLAVGDDGVGLPQDLDWSTASSLGLRLVQMLARQIDATVEICSSKGTAFTLAFALRHSRQAKNRDRGYP